MLLSPRRIRALHTSKAIDAHFRLFVARQARAGQPWALRSVDQGVPELDYKPEIRQKPRHSVAGETPPKRNWRVRLGIAAMALLPLVSLGASGTRPEESARGGVWVAGMPDQYVQPTVPERHGWHPTSTECVDVKQGGSLWSAAEQRAGELPGKPRRGLTNILQVVMAKRLPEGSNPNIIDPGCVQTPTLKVAGGLQNIMEHPEQNPALAADMQRINDQATLSDALNQKIPLADVQAAMSRMA
ncbi:MAG TPA: hypothetical protein VLE73_04585 [Candidatus Saccharimonadales bacterium]|nr:hypothetical protein [Candidatus Saccharimonadales bacterium]